MDTRLPEIPQAQSAESIDGSNLLYWARKTAKDDRRYYVRKSRAMSAQRIWGSLFPNLQQPIFILGAPRSGTTFLGSCLAEMPTISYHFEPVATKAAARYIYEGLWDFEKAKKFYTQVYAWLMRLYFDGDLRFAEKTPQISFIVPFLARAFPDAQFVHIIRDGRDSALSYSKKPWLRADAKSSNKVEPGGYQFGPYARFWVERDRVTEFETTTDIHRCIWAWRRFTEAVLNACDTLPPHRFYNIRYEQLVANPQQESDALLDFLKITDSESRCRFSQAVAKAKQDSVGAWQRELSAEQVEQIEQEAGLLLRKLDYD